MTARFSAILAGAFIAIGASSSAIGDTSPTIFRVVTMEGERSLAYYSVIERRYIFLGPEALEASAALAPSGVTATDAE